MMTWKQRLIDLAHLSGMCQENYSLLLRCGSKRSAVELYKRTINWALDEQFPPLKVLQEDFKGLEDYGIFVDKEFNGELLDSQSVYVFHNCRGHICTGLNVDLSCIPMMYFANGCDMVVEGTKIAPVRLPLSLYDNSLVQIESNGVQFIVQQYNDNN